MLLVRVLRLVGRWWKVLRGCVCVLGGERWWRGVVVWWQVGGGFVGTCRGIVMVVMPRSMWVRGGITGWRGAAWAEV